MNHSALLANAILIPIITPPIIVIAKPVRNTIGKTWIKNQKKLVKNKKRFN